jgi:parvulin-like peptidyl-prolyl isomerase
MMRIKSRLANACALVVVSGATSVCVPVGVAFAADTVIAKGGTIELGVEDVRSLVAALPDGAHSTTVSNLSSFEQLLRAEVVQRSVLSEARAKNFEHDPATMKQLQRIHDEALTRLWLASKATVPAGYPSEADIQTAYDSLRQNLPADYHLAQIYLAAPNGGDPAKLAAAFRKAGEIGNKMATADFAQLAREHSEQPESASKGGDLGFLPETNLLPEVLAAVRGLKPGEIVGPVKTTQGLHFLKLIERKPTTLPPMAEVHDRIVAALRTRRAQELEQSYVSEVASKLNITVNQIELAKLQANLK